MKRIFITGSTDGLGLAAARALMGNGHEVLLHARTRARADTLAADAKRALGVVIGDLGSLSATRQLADAVNRHGRMDAVIHNAGVYLARRNTTPDGHSATLAVNTLAPYVLSASILRPRRLIYLSSRMHRGGDASLHDIDWTARPWSQSQAYSDSKLFVTTLTLALARRWPDVLCHAVDPGWVPTRMGGADAPDDLQRGHETQVWLAGSEAPPVLRTGGYWYHLQRQAPHAAATDSAFQDRLLSKLAELTGVTLD
jgi:NAD(P)-dependent dehydrogenase (short-subunit alcohol dehydrogenase family)